MVTVWLKDDSMIESIDMSIEEFKDILPMLTEDKKNIVFKRNSDQDRR